VKKQPVVNVSFWLIVNEHKYRSEHCVVSVFCYTFLVRDNVSKLVLWPTFQDNCGGMIMIKAITYHSGFTNRVGGYPNGTSCR